VKKIFSILFALVLVVSFALTACGPGPESGSGFVFGSGSGERISFSIGTDDSYYDVTNLIVEDLQDFGLDVSVQSLDSGTFWEYLHDPAGGGMQAFVWADDPAPDPWSDWIWCYFADPTEWGYDWNPCWYDVPEFDALYFENYLATNMTRKSKILEEMQVMLAEDIPLVFLMREDIITACRTDRWDNWYNEMGGYATWINEYSIREVTNLTADSRLNLGVQALPNTLNMDQLDLTNTNPGCLYLMLVYENLAGYPKVGEDVSAAYDFVPKLATGYTVSYEDDGNGGENQIWTVNLREGVKWHDFDTSGEYLDADDVVYTCKYAINLWYPDMPFNWTAVEVNGWEILPEPEHVLVEKTGELQVTFTYIDGWHQNEGFFPCAYLWYAIVPEHVFGPDGEGVYENWNEDPM